MAGKPAVVTHVVDSMTDNLRPACAEATDVANAVLDESNESSDSESSDSEKPATEVKNSAGCYCTKEKPGIGRL
uniref:Pyruvate kinase n=1 Tax=Triticum urartu TaxID=4572 RepID=A0A8R7QCG8_TRIUA